MIIVIVVHWRRRLVPTPSPLLDLILAELLDDLLLVEAHEVPVTPLVEPPVLVYRRVLLPHLHEQQFRGADAPSQQRRVGLVEEHAGGGEHLAGDAGFEYAVLGEGGVRPADEAVVAVPGGLAMADEAEVVSRGTGRGAGVDAREGAAGGCDGQGRCDGLGRAQGR